MFKNKKLDKVPICMNQQERNSNYKVRLNVSKKSTKNDLLMRPKSNLSWSAKLLQLRQFTEYPRIKCSR